MPNVTECKTQAACSLIRMEGDAMMPEEPAPHPARIELSLTQILILPPPGWILLDLREQLFQPRRGLAGRLQWPASLAWAITRRHGITDRWIVLDVLRARLSGSARRTTEYSGGADSGEEDPVIRAITLCERSIHCVGGGQWVDRHGTQFMQCPPAFHRKMSTEFASSRQ